MGNMMHCLVGFEGMYYIDQDLISLPEIHGHLKDHGVAITHEVLMHWLFPHKTLDNGLRLLHDDNVCQLMSYCNTGTNVACLC